MLNLVEQKLPLDNRILLPVLTFLIGTIAVLTPKLFGALLSLALFIYLWKHKEQFVIFLLIYTPFEELILKMLPDASYAYVRFMWEGMLFVMMALMISENLFLSRRWKRSPIDIPALLFLGIWLVSTIDNSIPVISSLSVLKNIIRYVPIFYMIYNLKPDKIFLARIVRIIILVATIQSVICIGQAIEGDSLVEIFRPKDVIIDGKVIRGPDIQLGSYHTRFTGSFARSNDLGNYLTFAICFTLAAYLKIGRKPRYVIAIMLMLIALFLSSSRISWISAFFAIGLILMYARHRLRFAYFAGPVIILIIFVMGIATLDLKDTNEDFSVIDRFAYMFTGDYIDIISNTGRLYAIQRVMPAVFRAEPLIGLGPGSFLKISEQMSDDVVYADAQRLGLDLEPLRYVHDVGFVALFVQAGLLGLLAVLWIFVRIYNRASKAMVSEKDKLTAAFLLGLLGFIVAVGIQNTASFNLLYRNQSLIIWVVLGLGTLLAGRERARSSKLLTQKRFDI
ncbi:MAG: O-antigen ligase family protein [candidate division Zixibacteria bacterium]